jgi:hypothetical protein
VWFVAGQSPYILGGNFPPLAHVFFTPLLFVDFPLAYKIITLITLLCYLLITLLIPFWCDKSNGLSPLIMLLFITGLFSYGFQFELERGQFNVIAFSFCLLSIYLYHKHNRLCLLSYLLLSVSIQLKIYPAIFVVMLTKDWSDWKNNLKRFIGILSLNFLAFFALGVPIFVDFIRAVIKAQFLNVEVWMGNHSITSFTMLFSKKVLVTPCLSSWTWLGENIWLLQLALLAYVAANLFLMILKAYKQNMSELNSSLLLACTIGALLIPSISHDYKLSILPASMAIALPNILSSNYIHRARLLSALLLFITSVAYSSILFSYTNKPHYLHYNLPALVVILSSFTLLSIIKGKSDMDTTLA